MAKTRRVVRTTARRPRTRTAAQIATSILAEAFMIEREAGKLEQHAADLIASAKALRERADALTAIATDLKGSK
jgi:hypothetical protein